MKTLTKTIFLFKDLMIANGITGLVMLIAIILLSVSGNEIFGSFMLGLLVSNNKTFLKPLLRKSRNTKSIRKRSRRKV